MILSFLGALFALASPAHADTREWKALVEQDYGFTVDDSEVPFDPSELETIEQEFRVGALRYFPNIDTVKSIVQKPHFGDAYVEYGAYDYRHQRIEIIAEGPHFQATFLHEIFHALASEYPAAFQEFSAIAGWTSQAGEDDITLFHYNGLTFSDYQMHEQPETVEGAIHSDDFPSEYSKLGPNEMFAECGAAVALELDGVSTGLYRGSSFTQTPVHAWMQRFILSGAH